MAGFLNAVSASFILLLMMSVGYLMGHLGWMTAQEKKFISMFVVNIAVPCNCIVGLLNNLDRNSLAQAGPMLLASYLSIGIMLAVSMGVASLLHLPRERWGVFATMAGLSNTLFIGLPVCTQLFGEGCVGFLMLYYLGNTSYLQSAGLMLVERAGTAGGQKISVFGLLKDLFSKPPILSVLFTLVLLLMDVRLPQPIMKFSQYISDSVTPLALIYCGFIIYEVGLKNIRLMQGLPTMLVMRLILSPVVCLACCQVLGVTGLARDVFVVTSALPVPSQVTVMAGAFGADEEYSAVGACLSTFGSFITIPILMLVLG